MSARTQLFGLTLLFSLACPRTGLAAPGYAMTFLPPTVSQAVGIDNHINDAGLIAGVGNGTGFEDSTHAFLYEDGVMSDIGTLGGRVLVHDVNNRAQIVGRSGAVGFLYTNDRMVDLNSLIDCKLGWRVTEAFGINNAQQIVAAVSDAAGVVRFVRLDRVHAASDVTDQAPDKECHACGCSMPALP